MKTKTVHTLTLFAIYFLAVSATSCAKSPNRTIDLTTVELINGEENLYQCGDIFLGGQPSDSTLLFLKEEGVRLIVNLRSADEMEKFTSYGYAEDSLAHALGFTYVSLPMQGQGSFSPETLLRYAEIMEQYSGKAFIHCYAGYRACYLHMAWLVEYKNIPLDEVISFGRQVKYFNPLEGLLGDEFEHKN